MISYNMNSMPTWHGKRGYPPVPFPYRETPRPMPSSTLSSNHTEPTYPTQQVPTDNRRKHHYYKNSHTKSKTPRKKKRKGYWHRRHLVMSPFKRRKLVLITNALLLTLFWITLAALVAFGVYMYLYVFNFEDPTPTDGPTELQLVSRTFDGSFELLTIDGAAANFQPEHNDPNSDEYQALEEAVVASFDDVYMSIDNVTYVGSSVTGFREGSIIVDFHITFDLPQNSTLDLENLVRIELIDAIEGSSSAAESELLRGADGDTVVIVERVTSTDITTQTTESTTIENVIVIDPNCGNEYIELDSTRQSHQLRSKNYPGLNNDTNCTWLVISPQFTTVHIEFRDFGTTTESEYIRIGDGRNTSDVASVMFEYSGHQIPAGVFKSTDNAMWIKFVGNNGSRGFSMDIKYNIDCGGAVVLPTIYEPVIITSLGYPDGLDVPFHCLWWFVTPYETKMTVTIQDFDVIFPTDWLRLGDGLNETNQNSIIFEHSGQGVDVTTLVSGSNAMWMSYVSPEGTSQRGFNVTVIYGHLYECGKTSTTVYSDFHWPWLVTLMADDDVIQNYFCTAVIIDKSWLVTSATCLLDISSERFLKVMINDASEVIVQIQDFLLHPGFNSSFINDLGVIRLVQNLSFSDNIRHICKPTPMEVYERCLIVGLDMTNPIEIDPASLGTRDQCIDVHEKEFCVEIPDDVDINCQELQHMQMICSDQQGSWNLIGIVGNGSQCTEENNLLVSFTNMSAYIPWIYDAMLNWDQYETISVDCGQSVYELNSTNDEHTLYSPHYPSNYPLYITCDWLIKVPENYRILLKVVEFSTQFCCDLVTLNDVDSSFVLSGRVESSYLVSSGNQVYIVFETDKHITDRGFAIRIEAIHWQEATGYREL